MKGNLSIIPVENLHKQKDKVTLKVERPELRFESRNSDLLGRRANDKATVRKVLFTKGRFTRTLTASIG